MADLTATDLGLIRDEIGVAEPPTDADLEASFGELQNWISVALRVLKRRQAAVAGGGLSSLTVPGAIAIGLTKADLTTLNAQIARLERMLAAETDTPGQGASFSRLVRPSFR